MKPWLISIVTVALWNIAVAQGIDDDPAHGLTPAMMSQWNRVQMNYAKAIREYGAGSPEATQAQVEMNTLARRFGITPPTEIPESAPPVKEDVPDESDLQPAKEVLSEAEVTLKDKSPKGHVGSEEIPTPNNPVTP